LAREEPDDRTLVLRVQRGDHEAFGVLVDRHMRRAYFGALGLVGSHDDALDLSQDAFVRAYRARDSIDPDRPFYAWLYQILRRLCFNHLRDHRNRARRLREAHPWLADDAWSAAGRADPAITVEREEIRTRVRDSLALMPEREREVFVLKEFEGLKYREIGELLHIPIGTVMSRLYSARQRLANQLGDLL
jgi:RNA polymerase sigma-70 factor (ECF subfamily)